MVSYAQSGRLSGGLEGFGETLLNEYAWSLTGAGLGGKAWEDAHVAEASLAHGATGA